jgi:hypothetical protein
MSIFMILISAVLAEDESAPTINIAAIIAIVMSSLALLVVILFACILYESGAIKCCKRRVVNESP